MASRNRVAPHGEEAESIPKGILVASVVWIVELVFLYFAGFVDLLVVQSVFVLITAALLLFGSRIGWTIAVVGTSWDALARFNGDQPVWMLGFDGISLIALLLPSSMKWIWREGPSVQGHVLERLQYTPLSFLFIQREWIRRLPHHLFLWRLGFALIFLLGITGMLEAWEQGSGQGSSFVEFLAGAANVGVAVVLLTLIVTLSHWIYASLSGVKERRS